MIPIRADEFRFTTDDESLSYFVAIVERMMLLSGFSREECIGRINEGWSHVPAVVGEDDRIYSESPDYWANQFLYGHDSAWWVKEADRREMNLPPLRFLPFPRPPENPADPQFPVIVQNLSPPWLERSLSVTHGLSVYSRKPQGWLAKPQYRITDSQRRVFRATFDGGEYAFERLEQTVSDDELRELVLADLPWTGHERSRYIGRCGPLEGSELFAVTLRVFLGEGARDSGPLQDVTFIGCTSLFVIVVLVLPLAAIAWLLLRFVGLVAVAGVLVLIVLVSILFWPRRDLPNCPRCRSPLLHELAEQCLKCGHEWCNPIEPPKEAGSDNLDYDTEEEGIVDRWKCHEEPPGESSD